MAQPTAQTDRDLTSIHEARTLVRRAKAAADALAELTQEQIDAIVDAMAQAATAQAEALARLAHEETGYGVVADKVQKNLFSSEKVYQFIRPMKTVGVVRRIEDRKVIEIAEPFGVVAAIVPSTNPTSTAIYKILISLKARCPIVISPHPAAVRCISRVAEVMHEAARRAGAPDGAIGWMTTVTLEGTQELMKARETAVILATGGMGLVRAAYSAGKPAYGVGPGNAPAFIERTADVAKAVRDVVTGKTFDNGVLCSSENSVVVDAPIVDEVKRQFVANGAHFLSAGEMDAVARVLLSPQRLPNPALVGRPATYIAQQAGITVAPGTRVLIAELTGVGRDYPAVGREALPGAVLLRRQRLARGLRALQADPPLRRHGPHDVDPLPQRRRDSAVRAEEAGLPHRRQFADDARVDRAVDGPRSGDDARLRRLRRQHHVRQHLAAAPAEHQARRVRGDAGRARSPQPEPRATPPPAGADGCRRRRRRLRRPGRHRRRPSGPPDRSVPGVARLQRRYGTGGVAAAPTPAVSAAARLAEGCAIARTVGPLSKPLDFVCEDDVRQAMRQGRKLVIGERTIVTPAARDLGRAAPAVRAGRMAALRLLPASC